MVSWCNRHFIHIYQYHVIDTHSHWNDRKSTLDKIYNKFLNTYRYWSVASLVPKQFMITWTISAHNLWLQLFQILFFFLSKWVVCTFKSNKDNWKFFRQCLRTYDDMACLLYNNEKKKQVQMRCWIIICNRLRIRHINTAIT